MLVPLAVVALAPFVAAANPSWPSISTDLPSSGDGRDDVAVIVGITSYTDLSEVPGAAENARDWAELMQRGRGADVRLLLDHDAKREKIVRTLTKAAADVKAGGRLYFVFIGHGAPAKTGDDGVLLGADTGNDVDSIADRGVTQSEIAAIASKGRQSNTVLVYDACFSGKTPDGHDVIRGVQATVPVRRTHAAPSIITIAASDSFAGPLPGVNRPAFSYLLAGALRGWADRDGDRNITVDEAVGFVRGSLAQVLPGSDRVPRVEGNTAAVLARSGGERAPDVGAIARGRCGDGARWDGRACAEVPCPANTRYDGNVCAALTAAISCPSGTAWNAASSTCVASSIECPAGTTWSNGRCLASGVECPAGTSWSNGRCVSLGGVTCPSGTTWNGATCAGDVTVSSQAASGGSHEGELIPKQEGSGDAFAAIPPPTAGYAIDNVTPVASPPADGENTEVIPTPAPMPAVEAVVESDRPGRAKLAVAVAITALPTLAAGAGAWYALDKEAAGASNDTVLAYVAVPLTFVVGGLALAVGDSFAYRESEWLDIDDLNHKDRLAIGLGIGAALGAVAAGAMGALQATNVAPAARDAGKDVVLVAAPLAALVAGGVVGYFEWGNYDSYAPYADPSAPAGDAYVTPPPPPPPVDDGAPPPPPDAP